MQSMTRTSQQVRLGVLEQGRVVDCGTPEQVITENNIRKNFVVNAQVTINSISRKVQVYFLP